MRAAHKAQATQTPSGLHAVRSMLRPCCCCCCCCCARWLAAWMRRGRVQGKPSQARAQALPSNCCRQAAVAGRGVTEMEGTRCHPTGATTAGTHLLHVDAVLDLNGGSRGVGKEAHGRAQRLHAHQPQPWQAGGAGRATSGTSGERRKGEVRGAIAGSWTTTPLTVQHTYDTFFCLCGMRHATVR